MHDNRGDRPLEPLLDKPVANITWEGDVLQWWRIEKQIDHHKSRTDYENVQSRKPSILVMPTKWRHSIKLKTCSIQTEGTGLVIGAGIVSKYTWATQTFNNESAQTKTRKTPVYLHRTRYSHCMSSIRRDIMSPSLQWTTVSSFTTIFPINPRCQRLWWGSYRRNLFHAS